MKNEHAESAEKKLYMKPELKTFGSLVDMTKTVAMGGKNGDGGAAKSNDKTSA